MTDEEKKAQEAKERAEREAKEREEADEEEEEEEEERPSKKRRRAPPAPDWSKEIADLTNKLDAAEKKIEKATGIPAWLILAPVLILFVSAIVVPAARAVVAKLRARKSDAR